MAPRRIGWSGRIPLSGKVIMYDATGSLRNGMRIETTWWNPEQVLERRVAAMRYAAGGQHSRSWPFCPIESLM
jgi:hypothetical protein